MQQGRAQEPNRDGRPFACLALVLLTVLPSCASPPASPGPALPLVSPWWLPAVPATHDPLSTVLASLAASGPNLGWDGARQEVLSGYLSVLARRGPLSAPELFPTDAHVLAYLVNAHVAWTVALGRSERLRRRDVVALREVPFPLDGRTTTLAELTGEISRRAPFEPRVGLFLNPGWRGGPPLPRSALEGHSLEWQLAAHAALCGSTPGFWELDRERRAVKVSGFADFMWGLPEAQPARARRLVELVPPPAPLHQAMAATCGSSLQRCTVASSGIDGSRLLEAATRW